MTGYIKEAYNGRHVLDSINYRNLAPLYCDEEMSICCRKKSSSSDGDVYDVWIEGPTGGVAVKGTVHTTLQPLKEAAGNWQISRTNYRSTNTSPVVRPVPHSTPNSASNPQHRSTIKHEFEKDDSPDGASVKRPTMLGKAVVAKLSKPAVSNMSSKSGVKQKSSKPAVVTKLSKFAMPPMERPVDLSLPLIDIDTTGIEAVKVQPAESQTAEMHAVETHRPGTYTAERHTAESSTEKSHTEESLPEETHSTDPHTAGSSMVPRTPLRPTLRLDRLTDTLTVSSAGTNPVVRRIEAPPSRMRPKASLSIRRFLRRAARQTVDNAAIEAVPIVRTYRGRTYVRDPTSVAKRHSRYRRESVRKVVRARVRIPERFRGDSINSPKETNIS